MDKIQCIFCILFHNFCAVEYVDLPPPMRGPGHPMAQKPPMRPMPGGGRSPNPGEAPEVKSSKSSGGGMMTMILPVYAGGIVLYLIYTATKVNKQAGGKLSP